MCFLCQQAISPYCSKKMGAEWVQVYRRLAPEIYVPYDGIVVQNPIIHYKGKKEIDPEYIITELRRRDLDDFSISW